MLQPDLPVFTGGALGGAWADSSYNGGRLPDDGAVVAGGKAVAFKPGPWAGCQFYVVWPHAPLNASKYVGLSFKLAAAAAFSPDVDVGMQVKTAASASVPKVRARLCWVGPSQQELAWAGCTQALPPAPAVCLESRPAPPAAAIACRRHRLPPPAAGRAAAALPGRRPGADHLAVGLCASGRPGCWRRPDRRPVGLLGLWQHRQRRGADAAHHLPGLHCAGRAAARLPRLRRPESIAASARPAARTAAAAASSSATKAAAAAAAAAATAAASAPATTAPSAAAPSAARVEAAAAAATAAPCGQPAAAPDWQPSLALHVRQQHSVAGRHALCGARRERVRHAQLRRVPGQPERARGQAAHRLRRHRDVSLKLRFLGGGSGRAQMVAIRHERQRRPALCARQLLPAHTAGRRARRLPAGAPRS